MGLRDVLLGRRAGSSPAAASVEVTNTGQIGAANVPAEHRGSTNKSSEVDPRRTPPQGGLPAWAVPGGRSFRLRAVPTPLPPDVLRPYPQRGSSGPATSGGVGGSTGTSPGPWTGSALAGAPVEPNIPELHERAAARRHAQRAIGSDTPTHDVVALGEVGESQRFAVVDRRRTGDVPGGDPAGFPLTLTELEPIPHEQLFSPFMPVVRTPGTPPDRPRAGAAKPNEGRVARHPNPYWYHRPFDQRHAQRLTGQHGVLASPLAATPIRTSSEAAAPPSAPAGFRYSTPAPGMTPSGPAPNTYRLQPRPWDELIVNTGAGVNDPLMAQGRIPTAESGIARRGFGLR